LGPEKAKVESFGGPVHDFLMEFSGDLPKSSSAARSVNQRNNLAPRAGLCAKTKKPALPEEGPAVGWRIKIKAIPLLWSNLCSELFSFRWAFS
jgi:hypothetical protein